MLAPASTTLQIASGNESYTTEAVVLPFVTRVAPKDASGGGGRGGGGAKYAFLSRPAPALFLLTLYEQLSGRGSRFTLRCSRRSLEYTGSPILL